MKGEDLKIGDEVLVPARVVGFASTVDDPDAMVYVDAGVRLIARVADLYPHPDPAHLAKDEPPDGTYLVNPCDRVTLHPEVAHRNDTDAPVEPQRRYPRHWYLYVHAKTDDDRWVDWPTLVDRGFHPSQAINRVLDEIDARSGSANHHDTREEGSHVGSGRTED